MDLNGGILGTEWPQPSWEPVFFPAPQLSEVGWPTASELQGPGWVLGPTFPLPS